MTVRRPAGTAAAALTVLAAAGLPTACTDDAGAGAQPAPTVSLQPSDQGVVFAGP
ncbi:hypothetical protein ACFV0O_21975 [Kitasatospora sp. NPDC059577]|uniref:hypothetical protein n=1 Tax=unclassified Kitasatospora TaxID=2633591 RepID=UPI0036913228